MHAIMFQTKRCHLSNMAVGRKIFRGTKPIDDPDFDGVRDMTPARFDILYLVRGRKVGLLPAPGRIEMSELRKALGVARATVTKAVKRLVELGLVTCDLAAWSERNKIVTLTAEGEVRIKRALHLVFTGGAIAQHYRRLITHTFSGKPIRKRFRPWKIGEALLELSYELKHIARNNLDRTEDLYEIRAEPELIALPAIFGRPIPAFADDWAESES